MVYVGGESNFFERNKGERLGALKGMEVGGGDVW